jgi:hypothetical protein
MSINVIHVNYLKKITNIYATDDRKRVDSVSGIFKKYLKSIAVTAASLQILTAGKVLAVSPSRVYENAQVTMVKVPDRVRENSQATGQKVPNSVTSDTSDSETDQVTVVADSRKADTSKTIDDEPADNILGFLPRTPLSLPGLTKLLSTKVGSIEEIKKGALTQLDVSRVKWWKNSGIQFGVENAKTLVNSQMKTLVEYFSQFIMKIKELSTNWQLVAGVSVALVFVADIFQNSKQLNKLTEEQAAKLSEQALKIESIGADNADTVATLRAESMKLIEEVDSLIKQLDKKSAHIDSLSENLQGLSISVGSSDVNSKQVVSQLSRQLVSSEVLIKSLKGQLLETPKKVSRAIADEYKGQLLSYSKKIVEVEQKIVYMQSEAENHIAKAVSSATAISDQKSIEILKAKYDLEAERVASVELGEKVKMLAHSLAAAEDSLSAKELGLQKEVAEANSRLMEMKTLEAKNLKEMEVMTRESVELRAQLLEAQTFAAEQKSLEAAQMETKAHTVTPAPVQAAAAGDAQKLLNQLTAENDDLKQRLLSTDERLFDLQQESEKKLDSAKAMAKELNARLTEKGIQAENREGKILLQVKELEEATETANRMLIDAQLTLASHIAKSEMSIDEKHKTKAEETPVTIKAKVTSEKKTPVVGQKMTLEDLKELKPYQVIKVSDIECSV